MIAPRAWPVNLAVLLAAALAATGCGVAHLQTARTTPAGRTKTTVAASVISNDLRDFAFTDLPIDVMVRHGFHPRVDFGVRLFFGLGALADVKWNLLSPERKTALSVSGGFGAAVEPQSQPQPNTWIAHLPITVTVSRDLAPWVACYGAVGYGTYWIFDYGMRDPTMMYADRTVTGDGLLNLHAGFELSTSTGRAVLFEYGYIRPVVNDPGDLYSFTTSHLVSIGFRTR